MDYKALLYFDIETCGNYINSDEFRKCDSVGYSLFEKKCIRNNWNNTYNHGIWGAYLKKSGLLPEFGKIICISVGRFHQEQFKTLSYTGTELEILTEFEKVLQRAQSKTWTLCGYNIKQFDIPWINKKFYQYGITIPNVISTLNKKPWENDFIDLAEVWKSNGYEMASLDEVSYTLGIEFNKIIDGEDVHENFWDGKIELISEHCNTDVKNCYLIAEKIYKK